MQNTLSPSFDFSRVERRITVTLLAAQASARPASSRLHGQHPGRARS
ncbi:MAG: hypothetical protein IPO15_13435 [Anaerolineae bacterium]|nr:hypothetical protein [Anaerolineae bacterium]